MRRSRTKWVSGIGAVVLVAGLWMTGFGTGVTPAGATTAQNWDKNLPSSTRFTVLAAFGNHAVRDNNTGLVWQQTVGSGQADWNTVKHACVNLLFGGARGWRVPSVVELMSVMDPSLPPPHVPASVFSNVQSARYWSATTFVDGATFAWFVDFGSGNVNINDRSGTLRVWCVRGGMIADTY